MASILNIIKKIKTFKRHISIKKIIEKHKKKVNKPAQSTIYKKLYPLEAITFIVFTNPNKKKH